MEVNQKELAQCLGISDRQVRNLRADGMFSSTGKGRKYVLEKCVKEYINFKINAELGRRTSITKEEVQADHEEVKKQISLLKLRKLRREVHEAVDVEAFLSDMLIRFKNRILSLPPKLAMEISGESDINNIIKTIQNGLEDALEELSEYDPDEIDGVVNIREHYDEDLEDEDDDEE